MPDTTPAKTALTRFTDSLLDKCLAIRDEFFDEDRNNEVWLEFYYSHTPKNAARLIRAFPQVAPKVQPLMDELDKLTKARKEEIALDKARKADKRAKQEAAAKNVTAHGVRLNKIHPDTFATLNTSLATARVEYVAAVKKHRADQIANFRKWFAEELAKSIDDLKRFLKHSSIAPFVVHREGFGSASTYTIKDNAEAIMESHAEREAQSAFDAYLIKLAGKVGKPIASATLTGNLWNHSILGITTTDGEAQTWKTQCILNTSVLGNLYNQWPTIRLS